METAKSRNARTQPPPTNRQSPRGNVLHFGRRFGNGNRPTKDGIPQAKPGPQKHPKLMPPSARPNGNSRPKQTGTETREKSIRASFWQIFRNFLIFILVCMAVVAAAFTAFLVTVAYSGTRTAQKLTRDYLNEIDKSRLASEIIDAKGRLVGKTRAAAGAPYTTVPVDVVPEKFWSYVVRLEDKRWGQTPYWFGVDLSPGTVLAIVTMKRGGSTTAMMLARNLLGWSETQAQIRKSQPLWDRVSFSIARKVGEVAAGVSIAMAYRGNGDYEPFKRFFANHVPLATSEWGTIYGIHDAAEAVFGARPENMSAAELAVLASSIWRPAPTNLRSSTSDASERKWTAIIKRARRALELDTELSEEARNVEFKRLEAIEVNGPLRSQDLAGLSISKLAAASLDARREQFVGAESRLAQAEVGPASQAIHLTLDAKENVEFKRALTSSVTAIPLKSETLRCDQDSRCPATVVPLTFFARSRATDGSVERLYTDAAKTADAKVPLGSVAKLIAVLVAAQRGDTPATQYCRAWAGGLRDADGFPGSKDCRNPADWRVATRAIADSSNTAVWYLLRDVRESELKGYIDDLGFVLPPNQTARSAISFGTVEGSPRQVMNTLLAINCLLQGCRTGQPRLHIASQERASTASPDRLGARIAMALSTPSAKAYVDAVLKEVVKAGTLKYLKGQADFSMGKSGTAVGPSGGTRVKWAVGIFEDRSASRHVYVAMIASPDARHSFGARFPKPQFARAVQRLVS